MAGLLRVPLIGGERSLPKGGNLRFSTGSGLSGDDTIADVCTIVILNLFVQAQLRFQDPFDQIEWQCVGRNGC
ncbi:MAG: hypothetical protein BGO57_11745 [Sphingomonadales bacterium 63-6]|nr:MAG: hypothetical protein BGO57_11745 [Sphingomonadales bacterium 63-6]